MVVASGMMLSVVNVSIVNIALPEMADDLGVDVPSISWVVTGFLVTQATLLAIAGQGGRPLRAPADLRRRGHRAEPGVGALRAGAERPRAGRLPDPAGGRRLRDGADRVRLRRRAVRAARAGGRPRDHGRGPRAGAGAVAERGRGPGGGAGLAQRLLAHAGDGRRRARRRGAGAGGAAPARRRPRLRPRRRRRSRPSACSPCWSRCRAATPGGGPRRASRSRRPSGPARSRSSCCTSRAPTARCSTSASCGAGRSRRPTSRRWRRRRPCSAL